MNKTLPILTALFTASAFAYNTGNVLIMYKKGNVFDDLLPIDHDPQFVYF